MAASLTFNQAYAPWLIAACFAALSLGGCTAVNPLKTAPASADQSWQSPETNRLAKKLDGLTQDPMPPQIDLTHSYKLVDLVDLAQRSNRTTRVAWQAAVGVGLSQAEFYPILVLLTSYGGGLWDLDIRTSTTSVVSRCQTTSLAPCWVSSSRRMSISIWKLRARIACLTVGRHFAGCSSISARVAQE
jgi:outer membrane protein TolC